MSAITKDDKIVTASMLQDYHDQHVAPFLGGNVLGAQSNFKNSDIYSTTERIVGCWTDGRPLYQKTVTGTTPSASGLVTIAPTTAKEIIYAEGYLTDANGWRVYLSHNVEDTEPQTFAAGGDKDTGYKTWFTVGNACKSRPYVITIWYTKTTDAAGSYYLAGENDYSTDEKIIGKWIDGKNIYRKVYSVGPIPNATQKNIAHGITNLNRVIRLYGYCFAPNDPGQGGIDCTLPLPQSSAAGTANIAILVVGDYLRINTIFDHTAATEAYVVLEYTKTS